MCNGNWAPSSLRRRLTAFPPVSGMSRLTTLMTESRISSSPLSGYPPKRQPWHGSTFGRIARSRAITGRECLHSVYKWEGKLPTI